MNSLWFLRPPKFRFVFSKLNQTAYNTKLKGSPFLQKTPRTFFSTGHFPMDKIALLKKDVLLFSFEKTKLFRYITIFGIAQFGLCTFLGFNTFVSLKDTSLINRSNQDKKSWKDINLGDSKHRIVAGLLCIGIGFLAAFVSYTLPSRIIKHLTLCKGGKDALIVTYGPFGRTRKFQVPLQQMSCMITREQAKSYIPIKIKNKWLFYLIDIKGQFFQPDIFDLTVGARSWNR